MAPQPADNDGDRSLTGNSDRIISLPNALSLLRVVLMPFVIMALKHDHKAWLLALMLVATATDYLDGFIARRLHQVSDTGKIIDPLADKVCIGSICVCLSLWRGFPWWATALIVGRDVLILAGAVLLMKRIKAVPVSNWSGKWAVTVLAGAIISYAMRWQPWGFYFLLAGLALFVVSGLIYLRALFPQRSR
jgi:CDP-diacylglycerol---glycerol-3-phosphate 3-phosphatidyltransferase